jgi:hypothetical protein
LWLGSPIRPVQGIDLYSATLGRRPRRTVPVCAAKPPDTTERTAPMRVWASITTAALGIIARGMITRRQARDAVTEARESKAGRRRPARPVRSADQRSVML